MMPGRVFRLLLFGLVVALSMTTSVLIGYQPVVIISALMLGATVLGILMVRRLR
jgi:hypothetical protein